MKRAVLVLLVAGTARASTFEELGFGPRNIAMAGASTADATDYSAVFYNPAMLVLQKEINFGFSFNWARVTPTVTPTSQSGTLDCSYCEPPDAVGYTMGLLFPLAGKVKSRVAMGLGLYLPSARLLRVRMADKDRPFWYRYNNNPDRIIDFVSVGVRITDQLSIGAGVQALADLVGQGANVRVDLFSKDVKFGEIDSHLSTRVAPVAGLFFTPIKELRLGLNYRSEIALLVEIPAAVDLEGIGTLGFTVSGIAHYSPHSFTVGAAFDATPELTFTFDGQYQLWSLAPSPYMNLSIDLEGEALEALGLDDALDISSESTPPGFADTFTGRLGVEYRVSDRFAARGGVFYRPTPVPRQDPARTNIMDGSALGAAAGIGWAFDDPLEVFESAVKVDMAMHGALLLARTAAKTPPDRVPSYNYSARVFGFSIAVRYDFGGEAPKPAVAPEVAPIQETPSTD